MEIPCLFRDRFIDPSGAEETEYLVYHEPMLYKASQVDFGRIDPEDVRDRLWADRKK